MYLKKFFPPKFFTEEELKYPSEDLILSLISWGKFREAFNSYLKCKDQSEFEFGKRIRNSLN
jgi:hypothetical protein